MAPWYSHLQIAINEVKLYKTRVFNEPIRQMNCMYQKEIIIIIIKITVHVIKVNKKGKKGCYETSFPLLKICILNC